MSLNPDKPTVFISSDHAGFDAKTQIITALGGDYNFVDYGTNSATKSCDYPYYATKVVHAMMRSILNKKINTFGLLICGSGVGVSIVANANVLCVGARFTTVPEMCEMLSVFTTTQFAGGRHARRVKKINPRLLQRGPFVAIRSFFAKIFFSLDDN